MGQLLIKANAYSLYYVNWGFVQHVHCIHTLGAGILVLAKAASLWVVQLDRRCGKPGLYPRDSWWSDSVSAFLTYPVTA